MNQENYLPVVGPTLAMIAIIVVASFVMGMEYEDQTQEQDMYCQMVSIWKSQSDLPKDQRAGWPDYKNNYAEVCK